MIKRSGFVSNSSSSSFIVIGEKLDLRDQKDQDVYYVIGRNGKTQFGWENEVSSDIHSRINFCLLQTLIAKNLENFQMLMKVLHEYVNEYIYVGLTTWEWKYYLKKDDPEDYERILKDYGEEFATILKEEYDYTLRDIGFDQETNPLPDGYIDHQSSAEDDENLEMFDSEFELIKFIFSSDSYIETGNDQNDDY